MSEENKPADSNAQKPTGEDTVQISKSELEQMRAGQEFYNKVAERAKLYGDDYNPDEYFEDLESKTKETLEIEEELKQLKSNTKPEKSPEPKKEPVNAPAGLSEADLKLIKQANTNATTALMDSHYTRFTMAQNKLAEDKQTPHTREQLMKVIADEGPVIGKLVQKPKFGGNVFEVANYLLNVDKMAEVETTNNANRNTALNKAKQTASVDSSTGKVVTDDDNKTENDKLADSIAEDDPEVVLTQ